MLLKLIILFTVVPLTELFILFRIGSYLGFFTTIGIVIGTGIVGAYHAKQQGFKVLQRIQSEISQGRFPADNLLDGFLLLIAGIVLLTPGLLTDLLGLSLLFPFSRTRIRSWLKDKFSDMIHNGNMRIHF